MFTRSKKPQIIESKVVQHRIYSTLGMELPLIDLQTQKPVTLPRNLPQTIAALGVLFIDTSDAFKAQKPAVCKFLARVAELEIPTRIIIVPADAEAAAGEEGCSKARYDESVAGLPAGLLVPFNDSRVHVLKSFRSGDGLVPLPVLLMFDHAGNKINRNAWPDVAFELQQDANSRLGEFPYKQKDIANVKLFRAEYVNEKVCTNPCVMLLRFGVASAKAEGHSQLYEKIIRKFQQARGEGTGNKPRTEFFWTRCADELIVPKRAKNQCRMGHELKDLSAHGGATCNNCVASTLDNLPSMRDGKFQVCVPCNFALCPECYGKEVQLAHPDMLLLQVLLEEFNREMPPDDMPLRIVGWNLANNTAGKIWDVCASVDDEDRILPFFQKIDNSSDCKKQYMMVQSTEDDAYY